VPSSQASPSTIATVSNLAKRMGKVGVIAQNCPGYIGNRMASCYQTEAYFLAEEGVLPHHLDRILKDFGFLMGLFETCDLAGNDLAHLSAKTLRARSSSAQQRRSKIDLIIYRKGRYGVKTGKGWYQYPRGPLRPVVDPEVEQILLHYSKKKRVQRRDIPQEEILERCLYSLINEGFRLLEEGVARSPSDIDVVWVYGFGWPLYRGGPMFYADLLGVDQVLAAVDKYAKQHPDIQHWKAAPLLRKVASMGISLADYWKTKPEQSSHNEHKSNL